MIYYHRGFPGYIRVEMIRQTRNTYLSLNAEGTLPRQTFFKFPNETHDNYILLLAQHQYSPWGVAPDYSKLHNSDDEII